MYNASYQSYKYYYDDFHIALFVSSLCVFDPLQVSPAEQLKRFWWPNNTPIGKRNIEFGNDAQNVVNLA